MYSNGANLGFLGIRKQRGHNNYTATTNKLMGDNNYKPYVSRVRHQT